MLFVQAANIDSPQLSQTNPALRRFIPMVSLWEKKDRFGIPFTIQGEAP